MRTILYGYLSFLLFLSNSMHAKLYPYRCLPTDPDKELYSKEIRDKCAVDCFDLCWDKIIVINNVEYYHESKSKIEKNREGICPNREQACLCKCEGLKEVEYDDDSDEAMVDSDDNMVDGQ